MEDKALVAKILAGDRNAFSILIERYHRLVAHMVARLVDDDRDREEVAQDIFVKVYEKIGDFNFESKLSTWIGVIAYRQAVNALKKSKRNREDQDLDHINWNTGFEDLAFENDDYARFINTWIQRLPISYRTVLTLYHLDGMSYQEIVEIMDMPEGTVKNYLFRARRKLRELLETHMAQEVVL